MQGASLGNRRNVHLRLFVKEEYEPPKECDIEVPIGCDLKELHDIVSDNVLGGESERWRLLKETRTPHLGPDGGGHLEIAQEWASKEATLLTHPADDACPVRTLDPLELRGGADVYSVMLGQISRQPITSQEGLDAWWASHPYTGAPLLAAACGRLLAKLRVAPSNATPLQAAAKLVSEGLAGLRELASDRSYGPELPLDLVEKGLMAALRWVEHAPYSKPALLASILEAASAAAWALVSYSGPRRVLVGAGVVPELVSALRKAQEWRKVALDQGYASAAAAVMEQMAQVETTKAKLEAAAAEAEKVERTAAAKSSEGPELEAATAATDAAVDAAMRLNLPDSYPVLLRDHYIMPADEVSLQTANRIAYNCLGALAVMAIDARARSACLAVSPQLDFLLVSAITDFPSLNELQFELDVAAWHRRQERRTTADVAANQRFRRRRAEARERRAKAQQEARERAAREAAEAAAAAALEAELAAEAAALAASDPELAAILGSRSPSPTNKLASSPSPPTAADEASAATGYGGSSKSEEGESSGEEDDDDKEEEDVEEEWQPGEHPPDPYPVLEAVAPEDDARLLQVMAAEALYAMLGRERGVRRSFASSGGIVALEALLRSHNDRVVCAAASALASYGRDVGHDHTMGLDMLATAAQPPSPPPPPTEQAQAQTKSTAGRLRNLTAAPVDAPIEPRKDPIVENAGKVVASLITMLPAVLEALLSSYADGGREVGTVDPIGVIVSPVPTAGSPQSISTANSDDGGDKATSIAGQSEASPSHPQGTQEGPPPADANAGAGESLPSSQASPSSKGTDAPVLGRATPMQRVRFPPHPLSYVIEVTATAMWSAVAAEQRAVEIRAAMSAAAVAETAAEAAEAAAAAAAAEAAPPLTASSSFSTADGDGTASLLGGLSSAAGGPTPQAAAATAAAVAAATASAAEAMTETDACTTPITTVMLQHVSQLAIAAANLVPSEVEDIHRRQQLLDLQAGGGSTEDGESGSREGGGGAGGGGGTGGRSVSFLNLPDESEEEDDDAGGQQDGFGSGGRGVSGPPAPPHSHLLGALHALLGVLCVVQSNTRLVRSEFKALLARHAELRRLHVRKELAEDEYKALLEEMEAARKQPGQFFFEHEEEAKREKKRAAIRAVEADMRRQLRSLAAAEDALQAAADAAVRAVDATLTLLPYGATSDSPVLPEPVLPALDQQLRHCHVLAAGVVQAMAATLQPGAVDAAAAANTFIQRAWEADTSASGVFAATEAAAAVAAGDRSPEALVAATAAAALYQGPYRELILTSGVLEALLAAATARYSAATSLTVPTTVVGPTAVAVASAAATTTPGPASVGQSSVTSRHTTGILRNSVASAAPAGEPERGWDSAMNGAAASSRVRAGGSVSSSSRRGSEGPENLNGAGNGARTGHGGNNNASHRPGSGCHSPSRLSRLLSPTQQPLDTATNVMLQATSCALMHLASTENTLQPAQLVAIMGYMHTACHHVPSAPYLSAACYSLSRHVSNRRSMVEGVRALPTTPLGLKPAAVTATAVAAEANGVVSASAAARAAAASSSLAPGVWVEVVEVLLQGVLVKLRKAPHPNAGSRITFRTVDAERTVDTLPPAVPFGVLPSANTTSTINTKSTVNARGAAVPSARPMSSPLRQSTGSSMGTVSASASGAQAAALDGVLRSGRFLVMAVWLLLRQWVVDKVNPVNMIGNADGLYSEGDYSWWSVRFDADTPLLLSLELLEALGLVVEVAQASAVAAAIAAATAPIAIATVPTATGLGAASSFYTSAAAIAVASTNGAPAPLTAEPTYHRTHSVSAMGGTGGAGKGLTVWGGGKASSSTPGSGVAALRRLATRVVWSLSSAHPALAAALVERGSGVLALAAMRDDTAAADSELQALCCGYMLLLASRCPSLLPALGGLQSLSGALVGLVERALAAGGAKNKVVQTSSGESTTAPAAAFTAPDGRGVDVPLLEAAVRGLAFLAGHGHEGRVAVTASPAVRRLVAVVRADNGALEAVRRRRREAGIPALANPEELICPLRAINDLPITVPAAQAASLAALQPKQHRSPHVRSAMRPSSGGSSSPGRLRTPSGVSSVTAGGPLSPSARRAAGARVSISNAPNPPPPSGPYGTGLRSTSPEPGRSVTGGSGTAAGLDEELLIQSRQSGEADVGLMALWALMNLSGYEAAQTRICRHGLYTLMAAVHGSADPARSAAARAILTNIHYHPGNATVLYKAELKLKYAALSRMLQKEKQSKEAHDAALRRMAASVLAGHTITSVVNTASTSAPSANGESSSAAVDTSHRPMSPRGGNSQRSLRSARRNAATEVARQQLSALVAAAGRAAAAGPPEDAGGTGIQPGFAPPGSSITATAAAIPGAPAPGRPGSNGNMLASLSAALFSAESSTGAGAPRSSALSMSVGGAGGAPPGNPPSVLPAMGLVTQSATAPLGSSTTIAGANGDPGGGAVTGVVPVLDSNTIAARVKFLQWVLDPTVASNLDVPGPSRSGGVPPEVDSEGWLAEVSAALGSGDSDLMSTLTSDPEERHWLEMVTRKDFVDELEERQDARREAGTFMRSVLTRSLAGGANSLWKESVELKGNKSDSSGIANPRRQGSARHRGASSDPAVPGSDSGGDNRPQSASPHLLRNGASRPLSAAVLAGSADSQRRPGSALRASAPVPSLAWPPAARAAAAGACGHSNHSSTGSMSASATSRFVNLYGIPTGVTPSSTRYTPQPHKPRVVVGNGSVSARSVSGGSSASPRPPASAADFSLRGNPWAPHILRYVQDPPSKGGPEKRGDLATRMLTAVAPEYVMEELVGLTTKLMALTAERRREEDEARSAADTAAALAAMESAASVRSRLSSMYSVRKKSLAFDLDEPQEFTYSYVDCRDGPPVGPRGAAAAGTMTTRTWGHHRLRSTSKRRSLFSSGSSRKATTTEVEDSEDAKSVAAPEPANPVAVSLAAARAVLAEALVGRTRSESQEGETADEALEPRTAALAVSLLPPTIVSASSPPAAAATADDGGQSLGGGSAADAPVIAAPASVIAGGGTLTAVPSSYYKAGGTAGVGGIAVASVLSGTQAPSGLPHDSAASLLGTASYETISNTDPRFVGALHNPSDAYRKPHIGLACPAGTRIASLRSSRPDKSVLAGSGGAGSAGAAAEAAATAAAASGLTTPSVIAASVSPPSVQGGGSVMGAASYVSRSSTEFKPPVSENVPRPVTVLAGSVADLLAAKQAREADAAKRLLRISSVTEHNGTGPQDLFGSNALATTGAGTGTNGNGGQHQAAPAGSAVSGGGANTARATRGRVTISAPGGDRSSSGNANSHSSVKSHPTSKRSHSLSQVPSVQTPSPQAPSPPQSPPQGTPATQSDDGALGLFRPQPISVLVATGDGGTDRLYRFPRLLMAAPHHMCLFEHVDGCRFCEELYGHYLLPNGMLAHFYLGDTVVKGHRVDLVRAPDIPFFPADWVSDGFPSCTALADWGGNTPGRVLQLTSPSTGTSSGVAAGQLLEGLWCPIPLTAYPVRPADRCWLDWEDGGRQLLLCSLALEVRLKSVTRTEVTQEVVAPPPPPAPKTKKKKGVGSKGISGSRATSGRAGSRW